MRLYQQYATKNRCFIKNQRIKVRGIFVHSTGANNPNLRRYVQPDDGRLGVNNNGNSFNEYQPGGRSVMVSAFIGKLKDGSVATYQIAPWDMLVWHSGVGSKGAAYNMGYIGFEICEDDLQNREYFLATKREAAELCAYLCQKFGLDPLRDGVILNHNEGHKRGIASGHVDTDHWWGRYGYTMDMFRAEVASIMQAGKDTTLHADAPTAPQNAPEEDIMDVQKFIDGLTPAQAFQIMQKAQQHAGSLPEPAWSVEEGSWSRAAGAGLTDGKRPEAYCKRDEVASMIIRAGVDNLRPELDALRRQIFDINTD